jgi:nitrate reductase (NAD(P)H)
VLAEDLKTPDNHVERDPRLIRLTGVHPFNVEAPLTDLFDEGFLNTNDLHYVRNHGAVPRVEDSEVLDWEFTIEGMVSNPVKLTLRELIQTYEQVTYPITLVCAGNRRKEQNVVRKTKGFSWGAAGVSTALWTGATLSSLLSQAAPQRGAKYVCFEGADKLPNGYYGTSVKLAWAMDPDRGMMVAHKMNGEPLHPDHGKPLRIVIPGQIGGRSVKWLKRIIVTAAPSDNWYHIYDNRVLPMMISPEDSANLPETWKDERYAIYDLNTNSAICYPAHDERVALTAGGEGSYTLKGYAYAGGGKRVSRMEVTLDQGRTWMLATVSYPEDLYRLAPDGEVLYGGRLDVAWRESCFCWCFWELSVPLSRLQDAGDVMIRAMDDSMMVQPRDMYWSVLGMMNNPWYRVVIHKEAHALRFEHPTQPALMPGGWMERVKKAGGNIANGFWGEKRAGEDAAEVVEEPAKEISMVDDKVARQITVDELRQHSGEDQPWFVVNGQVYDGTPFLEGHPGGAASITNAAGQDVSEEFLAIRKSSSFSFDLPGNT